MKLVYEYKYTAVAIIKIIMIYIMYFALCLRKFFHLDPTPSTLNVSPSNHKTDQTDIYDKEHKTCDPKLCEVALTLELQLIAPI